MGIEWRFELNEGNIQTINDYLGFGFIPKDSEFIYFSGTHDYDSGEGNIEVCRSFDIYLGHDEHNNAREFVGITTCNPRSVSSQFYIRCDTEIEDPAIAARCTQDEIGEWTDDICNDYDKKVNPSCEGTSGINRTEGERAERINIMLAAMFECWAPAEFTAEHEDEIHSLALAIHQSSAAAEASYPFE